MAKTPFPPMAGDYIQRRSGPPSGARPTQAKRRLEWATRRFIQANASKAAKYLLGGSFAGTFPEVDLSFLRVAINLMQLGIRKVKFLDCVEGVVELLYIARSDKG